VGLCGRRVRGETVEEMEENYTHTAPIGCPRKPDAVFFWVSSLK
jgi:hypothetical protein